MAYFGQVDLHIAHIGLGPQEIVPHQPVEVERRGGARIGLHAQNLVQFHRDARHRLRHRICRLDRRALGHVDHDSQFLLVVEGQQLDRHMLRVK